VEGGARRYAANCGILVAGFRGARLRDPAARCAQAPIIVTVRMPADPLFRFETFYDRLAERGYVIYPGKLTVADSFRIGCIGAGRRRRCTACSDAIRDILKDMGVSRCGPA
jgi:2-aminoethylphosphonate-pyruvate transaminase